MPTPYSHVPLLPPMKSQAAGKGISGGGLSQCTALLRVWVPLLSRHKAGCRQGGLGRRKGEVGSKGCSCRQKAGWGGQGPHRDALPQYNRYRSA